jgi:hypothetical protein
LIGQTSHGQPGPFAPAPLQDLHHYYEPVRQRARRRYSTPCGAAAWDTPSPLPARQGVSGHAFSCSTRKPQTRLTSSTCRTPPGQKTAHPPGLSRDPFDTPVSMSSVSVSTRQQRFTRVRLPGPHLTPLGRLFPIAHHDGHQPTQHEVVWSLPPPGDSEGPKSFIFRAAPLQKLDLPNLLHVQDTPNARCPDAPACPSSASASCSPPRTNRRRDLHEIEPDPANRIRSARCHAERVSQTNETRHYHLCAYCQPSG